MKKIIVTAIIASMLLSFTACTAKETTTASTTTAFVTTVSEEITEKITETESVDEPAETNTAIEETTVEKITVAEQTVEDLVALAEAKKQEVMTDELQAAMDGLCAYNMLFDASAIFDFIGVFDNGLENDAEYAYFDFVHDTQQYIDYTEKYINANELEYYKIKNTENNTIDDFYNCIRAKLSNTFIDDEKLRGYLFGTTFEEYTEKTGVCFIENNNAIYSWSRPGAVDDVYTYTHSEKKDTEDGKCVSVYFNWYGEGATQVDGITEVQVVENNGAWVLNKIYFAYVDDTEFTELSIA